MFSSAKAINSSYRTFLHFLQKQIWSTFGMLLPGLVQNIKIQHQGRNKLRTLEKVEFFDIRVLFVEYFQLTIQKANRKMFSTCFSKSSYSSFYHKLLILCIYILLISIFLECYRKLKLSKYIESSV